MRAGTLLLVFAYSAAVSILPDEASAQLEAAIAVAGGSLVLNKAGDEFRQSIDRAQAAASSLLAQANEIAKARLDQIDEIANRTISEMIGQSEEAATRILTDAKKKVDDLEKQIMVDVAKVLWDAECGGRRLVISDMGTALGGLGRMLGTNQIRLTPPVRVLKTPAWYTGCFWWCDPYVVKITEPYERTYVTVKKLMEDAIADVTDETPATNIVGTYEYLSSFAKKASCFFPGTDERYNRESVEYEYQARQWNNVVKVRF
jgi:F0F1-type ATP synthase membrane subunit b/b'